jgi:hypothetical protein
MANTLQQQIAADAASGGAFFPGSGTGFDEDVTHYPAGQLSAGVTVRAVIDMDDEDAGGVGQGEGPMIDTAAGVKIRRNAILELPLAVTVTYRSGKATARPSLFDFYGFRWRAVRPVGKDVGAQSVRVTRLEKLSSRRVKQ